MNAHTKYVGRRKKERANIQKSATILDPIKCCAVVLNRLRYAIRIAGRKGYYVLRLENVAPKISISSVEYYASTKTKAIHDSLSNWFAAGSAEHACANGAAALTVGEQAHATTHEQCERNCVEPFDT
jgi:hypothetical protein